MADPDTSRFMRGGRYALALHLHEATGLPLMGLYDEVGALHHAFVADFDEEVAYDARGSTDLDQVQWHRGRECAGQEMREAAAEEVRTYADEHDPAHVSDLDEHIAATKGLRDIMPATGPVFR
ncbi:hypothetical protein [Salipiger sp. PrR003]|uniref:hypothetical protein n=1 Tax=Salipiger sp. PrR003 TaxID=2706776 RepID=UPI0013DD6F48|nr:hypothetical protein [Salipiger sp. PrR003]NDV50374.1 hypothetical protein [Salipiger sp. PrR003]